MDSLVGENMVKSLDFLFVDANDSENDWVRLYICNFQFLGSLKLTNLLSTTKSIWENGCFVRIHDSNK